MSNLSLYEISREYRDMVDHLMNTQDDAQAIADTIEGESGALITKAQNVAYAIRNMEAAAEAIQEAEKQMAERRKRIENRAGQIRDYLKNCMELAGVSKIDCPHFLLSIAKNPPAVEIFEQSLVPAHFLDFPEPPPPPAPRVDKAKVKKAIQGGQEVPGAKLSQGTRLVIK